MISDLKLIKHGLVNLWTGTLEGLCKTPQLMRFYQSNSAMQAVAMNIAQNKICLTKQDVEYIGCESENSKITSKLTHLNIAGNFLLPNSPAEFIDCQRLLSAKASFFGLIGSQIFASVFRDVKDPVSQTQSLVFVVVKNRGVIDQHAFIMIEHVSDIMTKELVVYELFQKKRIQAKRLYIKKSQIYQKIDTNS